MTYIEKLRALHTVARFMYGNDPSWATQSGVWALHEAMMRRAFWRMCPGCGE